MFAYFKILALVLTLTSCISATPVTLSKRAERIIGYRAAILKDVQSYEKAGNTLTWVGNLGKQIDEGVYTTPGPGDYFGDSNTHWHCAIYANSDAVDRIPKLWIPEWNIAGGKKRWWQPYFLESYIEQFGHDPAKAIRLSQIENSGALQGLIPVRLLNQKGGGLSIRTECKPDWRDLPQERINYNSWPNVQGC